MCGSDDRGAGLFDFGDILQMRFDDLLRISFRQVIRQRRRNLGVALAIAIGTAGLVVVITMGQDVKENINKDLELIGGATRIKLYFENLEKYSIVIPQCFWYSTRKALREIPAVDSVSLTAFMPWKKIYAKDGRKITARKLLATDEFYWGANGLAPVQGRLYGSKEVAGREKVCVLGEELARKIFGHEKAVGQLVYLEKNYYRVIGVLGGANIFQRSNYIFIPITTAEDRIARFNGATHVYVRCHTWDDVEGVAAAIPGVVKKNQPAPGLKVEVPWAILKQVKGTAWWIEFFVLLAVSATLVLGGLGIWNIMMAGVRSRTREIGLKKAIGARDKDIMEQFLTEALCLSLVPALFGIILSRGVVEVLASLFNIHLDEDLFLLCVGMGILFAVILGIGAGLSPSIRASRMEVISALRFE